MKCCNRKDKGQTKIEQHEPYYKPAIFTTRPNLQERNHVNKLWLWDQPDVRKISMSMDRVGKLCIPLTHQWLFVTQSECIYNCITVWTVSI